MLSLKTSFSQRTEAVRECQFFFKLSLEFKRKFEKKKSWLNVYVFDLHSDLDWNGHAPLAVVNSEGMLGYCSTKKRALWPLQSYSFSRSCIFRILLGNCFSHSTSLTSPHWFWKLFSVDTVHGFVCGSYWTRSPGVFGQWPGNELWPRTF